MEPVKDIAKVKKMFSMGQTFITDPSSGYKYSMVACCPKDGSLASVARVEKSGQQLSRVVFQCTSCFNQFEARQEDIYVF